MPPAAPFDHRPLRSLLAGLLVALVVMLALAPAGRADGGPVVMGISVAGSQFAAGPVGGGTTVTITGSGFGTTPSVSFGGVDATANVTAADDSSITVTSPAGIPAGTVDVQVTADGQQSPPNPPNDDFTYDAAPTVTSVSPTAGPPAGTNQVIKITGTGLGDATTVQFGLQSAAFTVVSDTEITAIAPPVLSGATVDITIGWPLGSSSTGPSDLYTYGPPSVSSVSPDAGPVAGNNTVTISGSGFTADSVVDFGQNNPATVTAVTSTQITATAPPGSAGLVDVTVTTPDGPSAITSSDEYTYGPPSVSSVSPDAGPVAGNNTVTINGSGFTADSVVDFGQNNPATVTAVTSTQITATAPPGSAGLVDVTVTTPDGPSAITSSDEYTYGPPSVSSVSPDAGPVAGNNTVTINGSGFTADSVVDFGQNNPATVTAVTSTQITATAPPGSAGLVDVTVTTPDGPSAITSSDEYTYGPPSVSSVSPDAGPVAGNNTVTINGSGFTADSVVDFGQNNPATVTAVTSTQITATAPPGSAGLVDVTVTTPDGPSAITSSDEYTYGPPSVSSVSPDAGPVAGNNTVTINGSGFTADSVVDFGQNNPATVTAVTSTQITATAPPGSAGLVDVTVTTPDGPSAITSSDEYTYGPPSVSSVSPDAGPVAGNNTVTINGSGFTADSVVDFGQNNPATVTAVTSTQITATAPPGSAGLVDVTVTTPDGPSAITSSDEYTYGPPSVSSVSPDAGPVAGNNTVTINGSGFTADSVVDFGQNNPATVTAVTSTQITATAPPGSAGLVDVTVTTPDGPSAITSSDEYTYGPPSVSSVSPDAGPVAGNNTVTINGSGFTADSVVDFGQNNPATVTAVTSTQITATAPPGSAGLVDVTVTTPDGPSATNSADHYSYDPVPAVNSITFPAAGPLGGGNPVTINGTGFTGATTVDFGQGNPAAITNVTSTSITATAPAGSGTVHITVTTPGGISATSSADQYTYEPAPTVTGISPNAGTLAANNITITGTGFASPASVSVGGTPATNVDVITPTQITATVPAENTGTVDVIVTTPGGPSATNSADHYSYDPVPAVNSITFPAAGPLGGGNPVTINGTGFTGATTVDFGQGNPAAITNVTSTSITATAPAGSGTVHITVTTPGGISATSSADQYTYEPAPTVTGISPNAGTLAANNITITGTGFASPASVSVGGTPATNVDVITPTQITATVPAENTGTVDVIVTTPGGPSATNSADHYSYDPIPAVTGLSPSDGPLAGTTSVTITGHDFTGATAVSFGSTAAVSFSVVSSTKITATSPADAVPGAVPVTVTTPGGVSTGGPEFSYISAPAVTGISPSAGPLSGGPTVTITGTGFTGATVVQFGGANASNVTVVSDTTITASPPSHAAAAVDVTVTTPAGGMSGTSSSDRYTYELAPAVTSLNPSAGPLSAGTVVTITGRGFGDATGVQFGNSTASFTITSATTINATAPAGSPGATAVTVTGPGGTSTVTGVYTYDSVPTSTSVNPSAGPLGGTNQVTIAGSYFVIGATTVTFGANSATQISVNSAGTQLTATVPAGSGTVPITVTTPGGSTNLPGAYTYDPAPTVTSVTPNGGPLHGTNQITVAGTNFISGATSVTFGSNAATQISVDPTGTVITATAPAGSGVVAVTVETPGGSATLQTAYTYTTAPVIGTVEPAAGPLTGGNSVIITGANFAGATANDITFGSNNATSATVNANGSITATVPAGAAGSVKVTVTTASGTSTLPNGYTYQPVPAVTSVSVGGGPTAGGNTVTIFGSNLNGATAVAFGSNPDLATITADASGLVTVEAPPGLSGIVDIVVTTPGGKSATVAADKYDYENAPTVQGIIGMQGPIGGGTAVTITGSGFTNDSLVSFGDVPATSVQVNSLTSISVAAPAHAAGTVDVTVTNFGGQSVTVAGDQFTYFSAPAVTGVSPDVGPLTGGAVVTISGTNFTDASSVSFGGIIEEPSSVTPTSITAVVPNSSSAGPVDVTVVAPGGTSATSPADQYTYAPVPSVTSVSPTALASAAGGTSVTITGTGFTDASAVAFGSTAAESFDVVSPTEIMAIAPPLPTGTVDVTVTTPGGTSPPSPVDDFTYLAVSSATGAPVVTQVTPAAGPLGGGIRVTLTGSHFTGATAVDFGGTAAASFVVQSDAQIVAVAPPHAAGSVVLMVTNAVGSSPTVPAVSFTYAPTPTVLTVRVGSLKANSSALSATINDGGLPLTACTFQYGKTDHYGRAASCATSAATNNGLLSLAARVKGLNPATTYHFRLEVGTAAGTIATSDEHFTTMQLPVLSAPLVGLLVERALGQPGAIGKLLGIEGIERGVAGESLQIRCVQVCARRDVLSLNRVKPPFAKVKVTLAQALTIAKTTRIEILVSKRGELGRFAVYAFAVAGSQLSVSLASSGCLATSGRQISCQAP